MKKIRLIVIIALAAVASCTPKLATKSTVEEYDEDLSAFRPTIEAGTKDGMSQEVNEFDRGTYVPPTNDINDEMAMAMDSIIYYNREKAYTTYTIQVYIGRSREEANKVREQVYRVMPEEKPTLGYKQPSWKVTVGEYPDHVDAFKTL
jgi:hypothetical protein